MRCVQVSDPRMLAVEVTAPMANAEDDGPPPEPEVRGLLPRLPGEYGGLSAAEHGGCSLMHSGGSTDRPVEY